MATGPRLPENNVRSLRDIVPDADIDGLLLNMAAEADKAQPQMVRDYSRRIGLGIAAVHPVVEIELHNTTVDREIAQLESL